MGGVYGHLIKFVRPVAQWQNSLQQEYVRFVEQSRLIRGKHVLMYPVALLNWASIEQI